MIRITVELLSARTGKRSILGIMDISNDGENKNPKRGNYMGRVYNKRAAQEGNLNNSNIQRVGNIKDFPRHSYVVWRLVLRMLRDMYPEEK